jgi:molybdopterin-guanine dinucleotide biosynthesis protein A
LRASGSEKVFVVACDMPHLAPDLIRHLCSLADEADVVVPEGEGGLEPLHAVFRKGVLPFVEDALRDGQCRVVSFFDRVRVRRVPLAEVERIDPGCSAFRNINTPEEYYRFRDDGGT